LPNDAHRDLAVLTHDLPGTEYYELDISKRTFKAGDNTDGARISELWPGDKINVRSGLITSLPMKSAVPMIEVAQKLSQGMSGGPRSMRTELLPESITKEDRARPEISQCTSKR
jgi:hypothetical protein